MAQSLSEVKERLEDIDWLSQPLTDTRSQSSVSIGLSGGTGRSSRVVFNRRGLRG